MADANGSRGGRPAANQIDDWLSLASSAKDAVGVPIDFRGVSIRAAEPKALADHMGVGSERIRAWLKGAGVDPLVANRRTYIDLVDFAAKLRRYYRGTSDAPAGAGIEAPISPFLEELTAKLQAYDALWRKTTEQIDIKVALAKWLWDGLLEDVTRGRITRLYFEAGSTVGFASRELLDRLRPQLASLPAGVKFATNNLLSFIDFAIQPRTPVGQPHKIYEVDLLPRGPFDPDFGAALGDLAAALPRSPTGVSRDPLEDDEPLCASVTKQFNDFFSGGEEAVAGQTKSKCLIVMTASGYVMDPKSAFPGPFVASHYNQLLKRCLLELNLPTIMLLDHAKLFIDKPDGRLFMISEQVDGWQKMLDTCPLTLAVGVPAGADVEATRGALRRAIPKAEVWEQVYGGVTVLCLQNKPSPAGDTS